jgi:hypothetical protein
MSIAVAGGSVVGTAEKYRWWRDPKLEMWFAWWVIIVFYNIFTISFFVLSRTQPPPKAWWPLPRVVQWFDHNHTGILIGFAIVFLVAGLSLTANGLIAYSMRRMSVSRVFAYSYLIIYSLAGVPGMLLTCIALTVGAMRPDRDPRLIGLLYDMGFLSFSGTMGIFLIGSLIWGVAILLDNNRVLPKWFGYLNLCNAMTEVVVAPCCMFKSGPFAWDGIIAWYVNIVVFGVYTGAFIMLLRNMIRREDFATGVMPDLARAPRP